MTRRRSRTSESLRKPLRGRAVDAADGMLHIEGDEGTTLCGEPVESYPLHWDTTTVIACGVCLMEAGVPLHTRSECGATSWQLDGYAICRGPSGHDDGHIWEVQ